MAKKQSKVADKWASEFGPGKKEGRVDWGAAPPALVHRLVALVSNAGGAVSFGTTTDGSAFTLYFLHDDIPKDKRRFVLGGEDQVEEEIQYWVNFWED